MAVVLLPTPPLKDATVIIMKIILALYETRKIESTTRVVLSES